MWNLDLKKMSDRNVKRGLFGGRNPQEGREGKERVKVVYTHV
jgi:hypothetical protein